MMRFLIDADLPRPLGRLIQNLGHDATDVRDIGLGAAPDRDVAAFAAANGLCLLTADFGFADIRNYPPRHYSGIVVFGLPPGATRPTILGIVEEFLRQAHLLERLPGHLAIVERGRVRLRSG